ncbi:MAG: hypothetical protein WBA61_04655 [Aequorivita sp.]
MKTKCSKPFLIAIERILTPPLLVYNEKRTYREQADVYTDTWRTVDKCIITRNHADCSYWDHK